MSLVVVAMAAVERPLAACPAGCTGSDGKCVIDFRDTDCSPEAIEAAADTNPFAEARVVAAVEMPLLPLPLPQLWS